MSEDEYQEGVGGANAPINETIDPVKAAEEAKAEEEFISTPEDTVSNPLVADEPKDDDSESEDRLKGAIGSGSLAVDYPEEEKAPESNESNAVAEAAAAETTTPEMVPATETPAAAVEEQQNTEAIAAATPVAGATTATVADMTSQANAGTQPKKKSKKGLIITLIIVFLLLIGGGVAFLIWMLLGNNPDNLLGDAITKLWGAENIQLSGSITAKGGDTPAIITFDGSKSGGNIGGSGKITVDNDGSKININYSASYIKDDSMYIKLEGLKDIPMETVLKNFMPVDSDGGNALQGGESSMVSAILEAVAGEIDGQWYKLGASSVKDIPFLGGSSCMLENIDGALSKDATKTLADTYKKHQFIVLDKDTAVKEENGVKYLTVTVDKDKLKEFTDSVKDADAYSKMAACFESGEKGEGEEEGKNKVTLGIKAFSHELVSVAIENEKDGSKLDMKVDYGKKEVTAPENAKEFELSGMLNGATKKAMSSYVEKECEKYSEYGDSFVELCKQSFEQSMGDSDFDISKLLGY